MTTREELLAATAERYRSSRREAKSRILDEFASVAGLHRKHAMRVLRDGPGPARSRSRPARRLYDESVREALILLWDASDRVCSKRVTPLGPARCAASPPGSGATSRRCGRGCPSRGARDRSRGRSAG